MRSNSTRVLNVKLIMFELNVITYGQMFSILTEQTNPDAQNNLHTFLVTIFAPK